MWQFVECVLMAVKLGYIVDFFREEPKLVGRGDNEYSHLERGALCTNRPQDLLMERSVSV